MGYLHINNLYKDTRILSFKECYALEKVHGTSAHISWENQILRFFSGGMSHELFKRIFDEEKLVEAFKALGQEDAAVEVFGEAYGGKEQGMRETYGSNASFIVFDVKIGDNWLDVPKAQKVAESLGLEFVPYTYGPADLSWIDKQRDADSEVAIRKGMGSGKKREGVVLRPPFEVRLNNGERLIAKHKTDDFRERKTPQPVDPEKLALLTRAEDIAEEWVTEMRLTHVLQHIPEPHGMEQTQKVILAMIEDVTREASGEILDSKEARKAIGKRAAKLFKERFEKKMRKES